MNKTSREEKERNFNQSLEVVKDVFKDKIIL